MVQRGNDNIVSDLLPPAGTRWCRFEQKAIEIRRLLGAEPYDRFEPEKLASLLNYQIVKLSSIDTLPISVRARVSGDHWSGAAIPVDHPDLGPAGLIVINDLQSRRRQRATLMEEICHLLLGHRPSRLTSSGRTYDRSVEEEAYAVGAATLLPYKALRELLCNGRSVNMISGKFDVSIALVHYRTRVLGLDRYSNRSII